MSHADGSSSPGTLNGWKEVAAFLGKSVRSVQRWERDLGLPVHRINTPDQGQIVYASRSEIEQWRARMDRRRTPLDDEPAPPIAPPAIVPEITTLPAPIVAAPQRSNRAALAGVVLTALLTGTVVGMWIARPGASGPDHFEFFGTAVQAVARSGHVLWKYDFGEPVSRVAVPGADGMVVDIDGDQAPEFILPVRFGGPLTTRPSRSDAVVCFRSDGTVVWRIEPAFTVMLDDRPFHGPWYLAAFTSPGVPASGRTWAAFNHNTWSPGFVLAVDADASETMQFLQAGWVTSLAYWKTARGPLLAAGGVSNAHERASIALLDVRRPAVAPAEPGPHVSCDGCPTADPAAYLLLPATEVTRASAVPYDMVSELSVIDSQLRVSTNDQLVGVITPANLQWTELEFSDSYWARHRALEAEGKIAHDADRCPKRFESWPLPRWTPAAGWVTESLVARAGPTPRK